MTTAAAEAASELIPRGHAVPAMICDIAPCAVSQAARRSLNRGHDDMKCDLWVLHAFAALASIPHAQ